MDGGVPRAKRPRLTLPPILDAAIALAREGGIAAVSTVRVSRALGTTPMSLYRYVESRDALVRAMLDRALDALTVPAP